MSSEICHWQLLTTARQLNGVAGTTLVWSKYAADGHKNEAVLNAQQPNLLLNKDTSSIF